MNIDESPLDFEVQRVFNSGFKPSFAGYTGHFKYGEKTVEVIRITDIDISSDFEMSFGPVIMIRVIILLGDYTTDVFPNQENLEFILKTEKVDPVSREADPEEGSITNVIYNAVLDPKARPFMSEDNNAENMSKLEQNLMSFVEIDVQLKPKLLDDINKTVVGGHFMDTTNADLLKTLITFYCKGMDLEDEETLLGVEMSGTASEVVCSNVVIPHTVMLGDLADYLQNKTGGIYPSGLAHFVQDRVWYVYPPYDTTGYDEAKEKITIISVPAKRYPQVEKTYLTENGITTILATGNKKIVSDKSVIRDNAGNGMIFTDANKMVSGFAAEKGNVVTMKRSENNSEFVGEQATNGKNNVRPSPEPITANPFAARSRIARSQGHFIWVEWENADPDLIEPGLKVKFMYLNEGEVKSISGVLVKCHRQTKMNGRGLMASGYRSFCVLVVFVKANEGEDIGNLGLD